MRQDTYALEIFKIGKHDRSVTGDGRIGVVVRDKAFEVDISQATETYVDHAKDLRGHPVMVGSH